MNRCSYFFIHFICMHQASGFFYYCYCRLHSWATYQKKMCILSRLYLPFFFSFCFQSFCLKFKWTRIYIFYRFNIISKYRYFIQSNVCIQYFIAIYTLECFEGIKKKLFLLCIVIKYSFVLLMHSLYINTWALCLCEFVPYIQFFYFLFFFLLAIRSGDDGLLSNIYCI